MVHSDRVLQFCCEELIPQLRNHNFNIILRIKIGKREYIGRLLHISDIGYFMDLDMGDGTVKQFSISVIDEMEIYGNAHNKFGDWKKEVQ